jgi:hypothetical protein
MFIGHEHKEETADEVMFPTFPPIVRSWLMGFSERLGITLERLTASWKLSRLCFLKQSRLLRPSVQLKLVSWHRGGNKFGNCVSA